MPKLKKSLTLIPKSKENRKNSLQQRMMNNNFKSKKNSLNSDNKIIDFCEAIQKLLGQLKSKPKKNIFNKKEFNK